MINQMRFQTMIIGMFIILLSSSGCQAINAMTFNPTPTLNPTYTPYPTYTLYPTYTPLPPTETPLPKLWTVKVLSAVKSLTFGTWYFPTTQPGEYLIATIEYTFNGQEPIQFSPQSLVLLDPEGSTYPGSALTVTNYQAEDSNVVNNFTAESPILTYIRPGQTKIERFGWALRVFPDTKFILLFPQTEPIDVIVNN